MKNNKDLVSIIIPFYNSEKYIERSIKSVLKQTYKNFELILINDGSIDKSENICKKFINNDKRIIYKFKNNGGVSSARNLGLSIANGKYICFLDSDDFYDCKFLEKMLRSIIRNDSDICYCNGKFYSNTKCRNVNKFFCRSNKKIDYFYDKIKSITCSFMIKSKIIFENNLKFPEDVSWAEDFFFFSCCFLASNSITNCNEFLYFLNSEDNITRLSCFDIKKIDSDKLIVNRILSFPFITEKIKKSIIYYRLPALLVYRLVIGAKKESLNVKEYYIKYKDDINKFKFCNGLRSIKLFFAKVKLNFVLKGEN